MEENLGQNKPVGILRWTTVFLSLAVMSIVAWSLYQSHMTLRNDLIKAQERHLKSLAALTALAINDFLNEHMESLGRLAADPEVRDLIENLPAGGKVPARSKIYDFQETHLSDIEAISVYSASGVLLSRSPEGSDIGKSHAGREDIRNVILRGRPWISNALKNEHGALVVTLSQPVFHKNKMIGFVQAEIMSLSIYERFVKQVDTGESCFAWIIDRNGTVMGHPSANIFGRNAVAFQKKSSPLINWRSFEEVVASMRAGHSGSGSYVSTGKIINDSEGAKTVVGYAPVSAPGAEWSVAVSIDNDETTRPIKENFYYNMWIFGLILAVTGLGVRTFFKIHEENQILSTEKKFLSVLAETAAQLQEREAQFRLTFESARDAIVWHVSETGEIVNCNPAAEQLLGADKETIFNNGFEAIFQPERKYDYIATLNDEIRVNGEADFDAEVMDSSGSLVPVHISSSVTTISDKKIVQSIIRDISDRKKSEEALNSFNQTLSQRVRELNCLYGMSRLMENRDLTLEDIFSKTVAFIPLSWRHPEITCARLRVEGREYKTPNFAETPWRLAAKVEQRDHVVGALEVFYLEEKPEADAGPFTSEEASLLDTMANRLSLLIEKKRAEERAEYLATHDALTGLPNRQDFIDKLNWSIAYARRYGGQRAVLFIDLDHFKKVNDTYGHEEGDKFLQEAARRLKEIMRESDYVCRLGGDEFTAILTSPGEQNPGVVAEKILESLSKPYFSNGIYIDFVTPSVGISVFPEDGDDVATLLRKADNAMYQAKKKRNSYCFHQDVVEG